MNRIQYQNQEKDIDTIHRVYSDYTGCIATSIPMCNSRQFYHMCIFVHTQPPPKYSTVSSQDLLLLPLYGCMPLSPFLTPDNHSPVLHLCNYVISLMLPRWNHAVHKQWELAFFTPWGSSRWLLISTVHSLLLLSSIAHVKPLHVFSILTDAAEWAMAWKRWPAVYTVPTLPTFSSILERITLFIFCQSHEWKSLIVWGHTFSWFYK